MQRKAKGRMQSKNGYFIKKPTPNRRPDKKYPTFDFFIVIKYQEILMVLKKKYSAMAIKRAMQKEEVLTHAQVFP
jgi:hypothetical protein